MRDSLHKMTHDTEITPDHPSPEELKFLMGRRGKTTLNWQQLLFDNFLDIEVPPNAADILAPHQMVAEMPALVSPDAVPVQPARRVWHENHFLPLQNAGHGLRLARLPSAPNVDVMPDTIERAVSRHTSTRAIAAVAIGFGHWFSIIRTPTMMRENLHYRL